MNISPPDANQKWMHLLLTVLTGGVVATAVVMMLVSKNIGAMQLAYWQMAAIYVVSVAICVRAGVRGISDESSGIAVADTHFSNTHHPESPPPEPIL